LARPSATGFPPKPRIQITGPCDPALGGDAGGHVEHERIVVCEGDANRQRIGAEELVGRAIRGHSLEGVRHDDAHVAGVGGAPRVIAGGPEVSAAANRHEAHSELPRKRERVVEGLHRRRWAKRLAGIHPAQRPRFHGYREALGAAGQSGLDALHEDRNALDPV
jgi:hypothetical protein